MQTNRRRFLSLLGIGAASAPLAAKAAADAEVSHLIGASRTGMVAVGGLPPSNLPSVLGNVANGEYVSPYVTAYKYTQAFGVPDFIKDKLRERSKGVYALDPDIAVKKSWSMAAKIHEQRQRNYQRQIEQYEVNGKHELAQSAFQKLTGFSWPW